MVSTSCIKLLEMVFESIDVTVVQLKLGKAKIKFDPDLITLSDIDQKLLENGFSIVKDQDELLVENIKHLLVKLIKQLPEREAKPKLTDYLTKELSTNYSQISKTFSRTEGITLERYFILLKIEKVKEWIEYGELSFKEIAFNLGYGTLQHLSSQFKKETGMSMSDYNELSKGQRRPIDKIL